MSAGVSPVSPVVVGTPAARTSYEATPVSPAVEKAATQTSVEPPSPLDPTQTEPRPPSDGLSGFNIYA